MAELQGMVIDYEWCTGCHTCETACQMEHGLPVGVFGIKLASVGPFQYSDKGWQLAYVPIPTDLCDLCQSRTEKGKLPACVHHCQAQCMRTGPIAEMAALAAEKPQQVLFTIKVPDREG